MTQNRFAWTFGVLAWGLPCGVAFALWRSSSGATGFWPWLALSLLVWCAGGYVFGRILWRRMRRTRAESDRRVDGE